MYERGGHIAQKGEKNHIPFKALEIKYTFAPSGKERHSFLFRF
jgi:hypothetical protein